ncbi:SET domain-containing protein 5 [Colletotrichum asianum]
MDLGLDLEGTIVVVTGAGGQIGQVIVEAFLKAGCFVAAVDIDESKLKRQHDNLLSMECDTSDERSVFSAWSAVAMRFGSWPTVCVCAAALDLSFVKHHASITEMSAEQFRKTLDVNVTGTFITAKAWLSHIPRTDGSSLGHLNSDRNFSLIIIGSEAGIMGVPGNPDYASSKSAVQYGLIIMGYDCGFDIYPQLEATERNIEKYERFRNAIIRKYENAFDPGSRHPDGKVLDILKESGSDFGTNYNISFLVGEIPHMPYAAQRCNYFLRFSSKVSGQLAAPAEPYIRQVFGIAKKYFGDRVRFWHDLDEDISKDDCYGYYEWQEVIDAEEELRRLSNR